MIVYFFYMVHEICSILKKVLSVLFSKVVLSECFDNYHILCWPCKDRFI